MARKQVPDLSFKVAPMRPHFTRRGYILAFYRHDYKGDEYLYHFETFFGDNGVALRAQAMRRGRDILTYKAGMPLRDIRLPVRGIEALKAIGACVANELDIVL